MSSIKSMFTPSTPPLQVRTLDLLRELRLTKPTMRLEFPRELVKPTPYSAEYTFGTNGRMYIANHCLIACYLEENATWDFVLELIEQPALSDKSTAAYTQYVLGNFEKNKIQLNIELFTQARESLEALHAEDPHKVNRVKRLCPELRRNIFSQHVRTTSATEATALAATVSRYLRYRLSNPSSNP